MKITDKTPTEPIRCHCGMLLHSCDCVGDIKEKKKRDELIHDEVFKSVPEDSEQLLG